MNASDNPMARSGEPILLVDDDADLLRRLSLRLSANGYHVTAVASAGVMTLSGQVSNTATGTKAIQAASSVEGVQEVNSELTVAR